MSAEQAATRRLSVIGVTSGYERADVLRNVTVEVKPATVTCILGANGAGKSTLIRSILGLNRVRKGEIYFGGDAISRMPTHKIAALGIATVPEGNRVLPRMTVLDNLKVGGLLMRDPRRVAARMEDLFALFPRLKERGKQLAGTLSGGERSMLSIARGLMTDPELIVFDEPSLGLSPLFVAEVFSIVRRLKASGRSVLLVEQNVRQTLDVADYGYLLVQGQVVAEGDAKSLKENDELHRPISGFNSDSRRRTMNNHVFERVNPLRKPKGFEPVVQRWSAGLANKCDAVCVAFYGIQGPDRESVYTSSFFPWIMEAIRLPGGPTVHDHAWFVDRHGLYTHIVALYWVDVSRRDAWFADSHVAGWWNQKTRLAERTGYFRESLTVPVERQETLYWRDYPAGLSRSPEVAVYPTPYCGYYGAMRDRIPLAAVDPLAPSMETLPAETVRETRSARWRITAPGNIAVIRSAAFWGRCDPAQTEDYMRDLRAPLERGMAFLKENPAATGCCSLRFQQTCDAQGRPELETHALGYFLSLQQMEQWSEHHPSHEAIFAAAIARYRKFGRANQLRTWHEVFVLPEQGQAFEYLNCAPGTGLLNYFEGERL